MNASPSSKPLAYEAYQELADHYANLIETKPHNAYYERPAMMARWPDLHSQRVLDAGCGPGLYAQLLLERGAIVTAVDVSDRMLELARCCSYQKQQPQHGRRYYIAHNATMGFCNRRGDVSCQAHRSMNSSTTNTKLASLTLTIRCTLLPAVRQ